MGKMRDALRSAEQTLAAARWFLESRDELRERVRALPALPTGEQATADAFRAHVAAVHKFMEEAAPASGFFGEYRAHVREQRQAGPAAPARAQPAAPSRAPTGKKVRRLGARLRAAGHEVPPDVLERCVGEAFGRVPRNQAATARDVHSQQFAELKRRLAAVEEGLVAQGWVAPFDGEESCLSLDSLQSSE